MELGVAVSGERVRVFEAGVRERWVAGVHAAGRDPGDGVVAVHARVLTQVDNGVAGYECKGPGQGSGQPRAQGERARRLVDSPGGGCRACVDPRRAPRTPPAVHTQDCPPVEEWRGILSRVGLG